jgi:iron complex transport system ATP-binding protein
MQDKAISVKNLSGGYTSEPILKNLNFEIKAGSFVAIAGPNGSGKSTLLKYLIHELESKNSSIMLFDKDISQMRQREIAKLISFEGQYIRCNEEFTVSEAVALGRYAYGDENSSEKLVNEALERVGILHLKDRLITRISGGEFQLAMLGRTICQNTPILALDEPVNNLDPNHQIKLLNLLSELSKEGKTILCVLHDLNAILRHCTDCIIIKDGKIFANDKTEKVITEQTIKEVYNIEIQMIENPESGKKVILF